MALPRFMNSACRVIPSTALLIFLETGLKDMSRVCLQQIEMETHSKLHLSPTAKCMRHNIVHGVNYKTRRILEKLVHTHCPILSLVKHAVVAPMGFRMG